jgi:CheY-like chemotaxis protein
VNTSVSITPVQREILMADAMVERLVILLVEDSQDDAIIMRRAFERAGISNPFYIVKDGESAIAYLRGMGKYALRDEYPLPALVLLDLDLPGMDGFEVLKWIRQADGLSALRVVVLTSSENIRDVNAAYDLGANSFMVKQMEIQNTVEVARIIQDYWLTKAKIPETQRPDEKVHHDKLENSGNKAREVGWTV